MNNEFSKFEKMRDDGLSPEVAYQSARADHQGDLFAFRMLRMVFGLSMSDAKRMVDSISRPQLPTVGKKVYWEGSDTVDGTWIVEAVVSKIEDGFVYVDHHRKFLLRPDGMQETSPEGSHTRISEQYFTKSLAERLNAATAFWQELMQI